MTSNIAGDVTDIDPISLEIQWQRLVAIADEIDTAVIRTSFSTIVGESHDFGCAIMDASGAGLTQAQWSPPQFCTMLPRTTRDMLKKFPAAALEEGDVLATNDPWIGSTHLPDYNLVSPVFHKGKLVAFLGTVAHVSDVGGHLGDLEASDMFMEGTRLMPNKFYARGQVVPIVEEFIAANCRVPEMVLGDLHAIVGTHRIGIKRIQEFLDDYRLDDIESLSHAIQGRSERALREAIAALPDGVSEYEITADGYLEPFTLRIRLEIRGSDLYMDFAGSSPQQWHSAINAAFNISYSTAVYPIKCMLAAHIPNNDGLVRPLHITAPEGSIVNCTFPAPVKARAKVIKHIPPLIFGALADLLPDEVIAAAGGIFPFHIVGQDARYGRFAVHMLPHGGLGATQDADGLLPAAYPHNSTVTPTEIIEKQCPIVMTRKAMLTDSGGAGKRRGGPGQEIALRHIGREPIMLTIRPDLMKYPAPGLHGGDAGALGDVFFEGVRLERFVPIQWQPGEEVVLRVPGGGGYGDPLERERADVQADVTSGLVSLEAARDIYGLDVRFDPEELQLEAIRACVENRFAD
ncbi:MAG: hydantoinase B/oxoprolinase family protein [Caldilineaceae bacterium]|nr:hydantoinase B/oxoprolinase family protein [Caldilineaceae bacterium]